MKKKWIVTLAVLAVLASTPLARAADHADGPLASMDPSADITDVFAWMSADASKVYLVMDLVRNATASSKFSDQVQYVFHTASSSAFGQPAAAPVNVICAFDAAQTVQCWAGEESYVSGNASGSAGITSSDGKLRVFAGLRNDPFFFNLAGFRETARIVAGAASGLTFDAAGCPQLDSGTSTALVTQLQSAPGGGPAVDSFADFDVLALVVAVDKSILTEGGPILGVWASTNKR